MGVRLYSENNCEKNKTTTANHLKKKRKIAAV